MRKKYLICERASKVQINLLKSCKLSSQSSLPKLIFFYCIKIYDALLYQTHLSPTNAAANNSQMWHSMPVYLFDIKHSTVVVLQYRVFHPNLAVLTWQQIFGDWVKGRRGRILWAFKLLLQQQLPIALCVVKSKEIFNILISLNFER